MPTCTNCQAQVTGPYCASCGQQAPNAQPSVTFAPKPSAPATQFSETVLIPSLNYVAPLAGVPNRSMGSTADNRFTADADRLLRSTGERIAWQGKPSITMLLPRVIAWSIVIFLAVVAAGILRQGFGWLLFWMGAASLHIGTGYLRWMNTTYRVTSQRIEYSSGTFSKTTAASPLSHVANVTILRPFPWNLMGLGHLELDMPDRSRPAGSRGHSNVRLWCLQNLETTRDLIHSSSGITNQVWDQHRFSH